VFSKFVLNREEGMIRKKVVTNLEACRALWDKFVVRRNVTDLWEFRDCFQKHFKNAPHFILLEDEQGVLGFCLCPTWKTKRSMFCFRVRRGTARRGLNEPSFA